MKRAKSLFAAVSMLIPMACADQATEPQLPHAIPGGTFSVAAPLHQSMKLDYVSVGTGVDAGPQDGTFDSFTIPNLGSVNNNGWTSFRTAVEFSLSGLPATATINSATLSVAIANVEGTRSVQVHGFAGDGAVGLGDLAHDGLIGSVTLQPVGGQVFTVDATAFVAQLVASRSSVAGFNIREEPANTANFLVMSTDLRGSPVLSVDFTVGPQVQPVAIDIKPGSALNSVNARSHGTIPVAILSSGTFDAPAAVDATSLTFGRTGGEASLAFCSGPEDVNGDGFLDMVCHFTTAATGFIAGDVQGSLKGTTRGGVAIDGTDAVRIVR